MEYDCEVVMQLTINLAKQNLKRKAQPLKAAVTRVTWQLLQRATPDLPTGVSRCLVTHSKLFLVDLCARVRTRQMPYRLRVPVWAQPT